MVMAIIELPHIQQELNKFAAEQWDKTLAFLQGTFSLSRSDCEDVFIDSFKILYENITKGKVDKITSTYFIYICRNKAYEKLRENKKYVHIIDEFPNSAKDESEDDRIDRLLALEDNTDQLEARKEAIVREIVRHLPEPCDKILWGFYREGFSMKILAQMYNYKSEGSVKVTKHRCSEKFKARFLEISKHLFD